MDKNEMRGKIEKGIFKFSNGVRVINTTPHACTFLDGEKIVTVPPSGLVINGKPQEEAVSEPFVTTKFVGDKEGEAIIAAIREVAPDVVIVGSIIAAQAYPEQVASVVPVPGFERVPPAEKRMRVDKFTIFLKK